MFTVLVYSLILNINNTLKAEAYSCVHNVNSSACNNYVIIRTKAKTTCLNYSYKYNYRPECISINRVIKDINQRYGY